MFPTSPFMHLVLKTKNRPEEEKSGLMKLLEEFLKRELNDMMKDEFDFGR